MESVPVTVKRSRSEDSPTMFEMSDLIKEFDRLFLQVYTKAVLDLDTKEEKFSTLRAIRFAYAINIDEPIRVLKDRYDETHMRLWERKINQLISELKNI